MFESLPPLLALVLGLALLVKGADWLVDGGVRIAGRLGMSPVMVGLTIIAWGTSLPELLVSSQGPEGGARGGDHRDGMGTGEPEHMMLDVARQRLFFAASSIRVSCRFLDSQLFCLFYPHEYQ